MNESISVVTASLHVMFNYRSKQNIQVYIVCENRWSYIFAVLFTFTYFPTLLSLPKYVDWNPHKYNANDRRRDKNCILNYILLHKQGPGLGNDKKKLLKMRLELCYKKCNHMQRFMIMPRVVPITNTEIFV